MADEKKPETKPCEHCGAAHDKATAMSSEELESNLLNLVSAYAMQKDITPTPSNLYVMGNALTRIGARFCFEAGSAQAQLEPDRKSVV
jgi:hypothetical protein